MNDVSGKQKLHLRLHPQGEDQWAIIDELAKEAEKTKDDPDAELRRLLRPHAEMRFADNDQGKRDKESRRRLDVALGALTMLEIAYQIGIVNFETEPVPQPESLKKLFKSEAFLRYVNAYLYFGIRFLAWRMTPPDWADPQDFKGERTRTSNQRPFPLITPPQPVIEPSEPANQEIAEDKLGKLIDLSSSCDPAIHRKDLTVGAQVRALDFLDGFTHDSSEDSNAGGESDVRTQSEHFELWLRGLYPEATLDEEERFRAIRQGLVDWAIERRDFYLSLSSESESSADNAAEGKKKSRPIGGWVVANPLAARFALADIYWISRLLKAEVSANASVTYTRSNWLHLLRFRALLDGDQQETKAPGQEKPGPVSELEKAEEVLRSVFDFVCDLVQNAVEITEEKEKRAYEPELFPDATAKWRKDLPPAAKWRKVFNEELNEIQQQRDRREFKAKPPAEGASPPIGAAGGDNNPADPDGDDWMERIRKEKTMHNLIGLSFSGGGIRSATFNLGVLQGLQEFDLLRKIDFLSTVSGGGFIGSWLVANVCRTHHWLGRLMNWEESINHLRSYSNYLAPRLGVFTADTWTMWASWARNAFLIQLTCLAWLWAALPLALLGHSVFLRCGTTSAFLVAVGMMGIVWLTLVYNLSGRRAVSGESSAAKIKPWSERWVWSLAIVPAWIFSFLLAGWMWAEAKSTAFQDVIREIEAHSRIARRAVSAWPYLIWLALGLLAFFTLSRLQKQNVAERRPQKYPIPKRLWHAAWTSALSVFVLGLEFKGILTLFISWSANSHQYSWYAYVLGPPLVLAAHTLSVVLFIGFCGRHSKEAIREWWTRFGAGLAMFGAAYLALTTAAVFGPPWTLYLFSVGGVKWGSIISWVGTVVGGVLAGDRKSVV